MLLLYKYLTYLSGPLLHLLLRYRAWKGKEDLSRLNERFGQPKSPRPDGALIWVHAASVGEAQSALILINKLSQGNAALKFLVTSGTKTSADLMAKRLPKNAQHQYYPLDHAHWVQRFLNHWKPDLALWMESELWPNMLQGLKAKNIPAILVNARLSERSFKRWSFFKSSAHKMLSSFTMILAQTETDKTRFNKLGLHSVPVTDNLKYSAAPLPFDSHALQSLKTAIGLRPTWLYASTHEGEETLAARVHMDLATIYPDLLTIIVPRHPERRADIEKQLHVMGIKTTLRGTDKNLPDDKTEIYVADTLGELGLFYSLSDIAMIGRSFSNDGGGGHNPIEAAQLNCAVLTGPNIQYQTQLFDDMFAANAATQTHTEKELYERLKHYFNSENNLQYAKQSALNFAQSKDDIVSNVIQHIQPYTPKKS